MAEEQEVSKRHRSPAYPAIGLREAVSRLTRFYGDQRRALVHLDAAYESLGYQKGSSSGARVVAALMSYGLMADEGSGVGRKVKITDAGYKLMILEEDDSRRLEVLREAAKAPKIYEELISKWGDHLPNDSAIRSHLLLELNFNPNFVGPLIRDFRDTFEFAELAGEEKAVAVDRHEDVSEALKGFSRGFANFDGSDQAPPPVRNDIPGTSTFPILLSGGRQIVVQYPSNITSKDIEEFEAIWQIYKKRIVTDQGGSDR